MSVDRVWDPEIVPGGGRDSREKRRKERARTLWEEAQSLVATDPDGALEVFIEANDEGMSLPVTKGRRCFLTGADALGYARVPGTAWDADVAISHGRDEQRPTALDRWVGGWSDGTGVPRKPMRPTGVVTVRNDVPMLRLASVKGTDRPGPEGPMHRIGALENGAWVEFDVQRDGSIVLRRFTPDTAGPHPLED